MVRGWCLLLSFLVPLVRQSIGFCLVAPGEWRVGSRVRNETKRTKHSDSSVKSVGGEAEIANSPAAHHDTRQRELPPLSEDASAALGSLTRAPRVYVGGGGSHLNAGQIVTLSPEQARYLVSVMRLRDGSQVRVFDGVNGEFKAVVRNVGKSRRAKRSTAKDTEQAELRIECLTRRQPTSSSVGEDGYPGPPAVELMFAPIRKQRLKILVEKAVEVGASRLTPVLTARTQSSAADENTLGKLGMMTAVEAAEQCERMTVPHVGATPVPLASLLEDLEARHRDAASSGAAGTTREPGVVGHDCCESGTEDPVVAADVVFVCKERDVDAPPLLDALADYARARRNITGGRNGAAFLIGPEGGFDEAEIRLLASCPLVQFVSLGPTVLRAETAAVYALSCWSAFWASSRAEGGPPPGNKNAAQE